MEYRALVAYDWEAVDPAELSVVTGQIVRVQDVNDRGWALVLNQENGNSGWVPNDYLQPLDEEIVEDIQPFEQPTPQQPSPAQYNDAQIQHAMNALSLAAQPQVQQQQVQSHQPQPTNSQVCGACSLPIDASALIAKGKHFHPDCFQCATCRKTLSGGFLERDGQFFCEEDYYRTQGHICAHCDQPIIGSHILGNNKPYHVDHLLCSMCNVSIGTNVLHVKDDKNICHDCYNTSFASVCATCNQPIEFQIFSAMEKSYHKECFVCSEGGHQMPDESFHVHEGAIYCADHYKKLFSKPCHGCKQDISGQYLEVVGHYFHSGCWKCTMCSSLLESTGCSVKNDQFYCPACVVKVPSTIAPKPAAAPATAPAPKPATAPKPAAAPVTQPAQPVTQPFASAAPAPATTQNVGLLDTLHQSGDDISVEEMRRRLLEVSERALAEANKEKSVELLPVKNFYTHAELINSDHLPPAVDRSKKESYLTDEEFQAVFKMDRVKFAALKLWKQQELKKGAKIF